MELTYLGVFCRMKGRWALFTVKILLGLRMREARPCPFAELFHPSLLGTHLNTDRHRSGD